MALDPVTAGLDLANTVVNKIWPDKSEQERAQLAAAVQLVQGQLEINKAEAASASVFVAGWRPAIGWCCAFAMFFKFIGGPLLVMIGAYAGVDIKLPAIDSGELMPILLGMLGLGAMRSFEKVKGVA